MEQMNEGVPPPPPPPPIKGQEPNAHEASASLIKYTVQVLKRIISRVEGSNSRKLSLLEQSYKSYLERGFQAKDVSTHHSIFVEKLRHAIGSNFVDAALKSITGGVDVERISQIAPKEDPQTRIPNKNLRTELVKALASAQRGNPPDLATKELVDHLEQCENLNCSFRTARGSCSLAKTLLRKGSTSGRRGGGIREASSRQDFNVSGSRGRGRGRGRSGRRGRGRARSASVLSSSSSGKRKNEARDEEQEVDFDDPTEIKDTTSKKSKLAGYMYEQMVPMKRKSNSNGKGESLIALGRKTYSPKSQHNKEDFVELEDAGGTIKDTEEDVVRVTGIDDEKEAEELIRVGTFSQMTAGQKREELWTNSLFLHSPNQFNVMKTVAEHHFPPVKICRNQESFEQCKRFEFMGRALQDYVELKLRQLIRMARQRHPDTDKIVITKVDLRVLNDICGPAFAAHI